MAGADPEKLELSWEQVEAMSVDLADQVEASNAYYNVLLALPRGSFYPVNVLSQRFGMTAERIQSASLTAYIPGTTTRADKITEGQFPAADAVAGQKILIVDEMCDTGSTLKYATEELYGLGAFTVHSAVLHYKPSKSTTGFVPDFYVAQTDRWIVYPWEKHAVAGETSRLRTRRADDLVTA